MMLFKFFNGLEKFSVIVTEKLIWLFCVSSSSVFEQAPKISIENNKRPVEILFLLFFEIKKSFKLSLLFNFVVVNCYILNFAALLFYIISAWVSISCL